MQKFALRTLLTHAIQPVATDFSSMFWIRKLFRAFIQVHLFGLDGFTNSFDRT